MNPGQREVPAPQRKPIEPPNGTALPRRSPFRPDVWLRYDEPNADGDKPEERWWRTGDEHAYTWADAQREGADPSGRLVVVDPTDEQQVEWIAVALSKQGGVFADVRQAARAALRALVEQP